MSDLSGKAWTAGEALGASHRTDHNNLATVDARVSRMESERGQRPGAVCFSWDDGYSEALVAAEEAEERNQRHTFYITTGLLGTSGFISDADVEALAAAGHEVAAHSVNHDSYTDDLTAAQRATDMDTCKAYLEALSGVPTVASFAYPYSDRNVTTDREAYGRFWNVAAVTTIGRPLWMPDYRPFLFYREHWTTARHDAVLESIRLAASQPVIVHIYNHKPGTDPTLTQLREALDLADSLGVPVVGTSEVMPTGPNLRNPLPGSTIDGWHSVTSGTGTTTVQAGTPPTGTPGSNVFRLESGDDSSFAYLRQHLPVVPGRTYSLSALARKTMTSGDDATAVQVRVSTIDSAGSAIAITGEALTTGENDGEWYRLQEDVTVPAACMGVDVDMLLLNATGFAEFCHLSWDETRFGSFGG